MSYEALTEKWNDVSWITSVSFSRSVKQNVDHGKLIAKPGNGNEKSYTYPVYEFDGKFISYL